MSRTVFSPSLLFGLLLATAVGLRADASIYVLWDVCNGGCKRSSALGYIPHPLNGQRSFRAEGAHCCERHADGARRVVHLLRGGAAGPSISDHSHKVVSPRGSDTPSTTTLAKDTNLSHTVEPLAASGDESPDVEALEGAVLRQGDRSISLKGLPETRAGLGAAGKVRGGLVTDIISRAFRIDKPELKKFLCMSSMMFAIIYVFTMTRDTKDALVVTNCGAEAIAFLKVYAVLPAAAMFMLGYNWLSNQVSSRALFHLTITPFLAFYAIFAFVMYPMRGILHHAGGAMGKDEHMFSHMINLGRFWMFSLYYVVSELWGSAGVPLLFWTCANEVTPISQAKRFYPMFAILGNLAPIASGQTMAYVSRHRDKTMDADAAFQRTLKVLSSFILCAGGVIMVLYEMVMAMTDRAAESSGAESTTRVGRNKDKLKPKMSLMESFRFLSKSKYLGYVGLMVVSYGLAMEFTEIVWKAIVKLAYPDKSDYMAFMGQYSTIVGATTFVMLLIGKEVIKYMGWEAGALATPLMMTLLAIPFFGYIILGNIQQSRKTLMQALWVGMIQNVLSKATKYALFDPTKEMSYIPLDKESKVKGKAAIDVLGARLGKSGGALAQQGLVVACGSILTGAPVLATLFGLVSVMWITSVLNLSKLFKVKQAEAEEAAAKPEER